MNDKSQHAHPHKRSPSSEEARRSAISSSLDRFEKRQSELWRLTFLILFLWVLAYAWTSWGSVRSLAHHFEAPPIGLVVLVALFGVYLWKKTREISELRGLLRGIEERDAQPPSDKQLDQLFEIISKSQQGYRDLIDSFDDILLALSVEGKIRAVNRSFSDLVQTPFQEIIGRPISEFVEESNGEGPELLKRAMPRFLERRQWTGILQVRLKNQKSPFYFDCVAHAMLRDDQIHGITLLARDVSAPPERNPLHRAFRNAPGRHLHGHPRRPHPGRQPRAGAHARLRIQRRPAQTPGERNSPGSGRAQSAHAPGRKPADGSGSRNHAASQRRHFHRVPEHHSRRSGQRRQSGPVPGRGYGHHRAPRDGTPPSSAAGIRTPPGRQFSRPHPRAGRGLPLHFRQPALPGSARLPPR